MYGYYMSTHIVSGENGIAFKNLTIHTGKKKHTTD